MKHRQCHLPHGSAASASTAIQVLEKSQVSSLSLSLFKQQVVSQCVMVCNGASLRQSVHVLDTFWERTVYSCP